MKHLYLLVIFTFSLLIVKSQNAGDYRSLATGSWESPSSWQTFDGVTWIAASASPSSADGVITIRSPHTITMSVSTGVDELIILTGGSLVLNAALPVEDGPDDDIIVNGTLTSNIEIFGFGNLLVNGVFNWFGILSAPTTIGATGVVNINTNATERQLTQSLTNNGTINLVSGSIAGGELINDGTINKLSVNTFSINSIWINSGTLQVSAGTLLNASDDLSGNYFQNIGSITIASGATFNNSGNLIHDAGSITGAGTFLQNGNVVTNANLTVQSTITFIQNSGIISGAANFTVTNLVMNGGSIEDAGALSLLGTTTWVAGTIIRNVTITAANTINLIGAADKFIGGTFIVAGTMNISAGIVSSVGGTFAVSGTLNKITTADATIMMSWSNTGTINVVAGNLISEAVNGEVFTKSGTINISSGASFTNAGFFIHAGGSVTGSGSFIQAGTDLQLNAAMVIAPGVLFIQNEGAISGVGAFTATGAQINNGLIANTGALSFLGTTTWAGGEIARAFTIAAGNIFSVVTGPNARVLTSAMTINGTLLLTAADILDGGGSITNNGTISVAAGTSAVDVPITNASAGRITGIGVLTINNTFSNTGTVDPGTTIGKLTLNGPELFSASSTLAIQINSLAGAGVGHDLLERDSDLALNGTLTVTETAVIPSNNSFVIINLLAGEITGTFSTVNIPAGYTLVINPTTVVLVKGTVVPVRMISFTASKDSRNHVALRWITDNELNNSHFLVERSGDGRMYSSIGTVNANNQPGRNTYGFIDASPLRGMNHYRLKQIDLDGRIAVSEVRVVETDKLTLSLSPNPVIDLINIKGAEGYKEFMIVDASGKVVKQTRAIGVADVLSINISELRTGQYYLRATGTESRTIPFIKK